ncbi:hypothetical protein LTR78_008970 [Recurvomyces mirabilis]|uniref:Uncharacterized protein n=1 Tax=Recurvomyces mirabilis TaxID=574656 RepID=A0AAE0WGR2_9PEZI|nr:hypothetical protein LTR78_008970 [Recurvomyces mirabilis]KAK5159771.1 hypothetical protein LTS14_001876 [Recurvomyces mirabilis]
MASAAAVGANAALSPRRNDDLDDGEITSAVGSKAVDSTDFIDDEDLEDDPIGTGRRKAAATENEDGDGLGLGDAGDEDLFGDDEPETAPKRRLDDEELDSGDDMDRNDRAAEDGEAPAEEALVEAEQVMMDIDMSRQPIPEPSDGEMYLLKMPDFMAIEPQAWSHDRFQPPTTEHHSNKPASTSFSAYNTALSTIRWRHSPSDHKKIQSNARILRWSDGSCTFQMGSQPNVQYEIDGNSLAPPQRNPLKPTPLSIQAASSKGGRQGDGTVQGEKYDPSKEAFTYLVVPNEATSTLRVTHKITGGLSMRQPASVQDDAIERLQAALATAANATKVNGAGGPLELEMIDVDPDKQRLAAEKFMKDKDRAARRKLAAAERDADRSTKVLGRASRYGGSGGGGLSTGMLEDDGDGGIGTTRGSGRKAGGGAKKSRQRRNSIYSDDEDFGRKHFTSKEDEYDEEDDFLAPSDEEEVVEGDGEEEEDEDDGIVEEGRVRERERERERTPKRDRREVGGEGEGEDADADAEGEVDEGAAQAARTKRRRVVDEDEDEDEE